MFGRLLPRAAPYYEYFHKQNKLLREIAKELTLVVAAPNESELNLKRIGELEMEADNIHHLVLEDLSQTFITPIDREDIYAISNAQERTIDSLQGLGARFYLFSFVKIRFPAVKMVENLAAMADAIGTMLECLEAHSRAAEPARILQELRENCEMLLNVGLGEIQDSTIDNFEQMKEVMVMAQLYDRIENTVDLFADLTDTLEQAVLKYA